MNKPPLIPKKWLEYLFRGKRKNDLHYRYPKTELEIWFRKLSHFYLFRPPIKENIEIVRKFKKQGCQLYLISSRYSFLKKETAAWLEKRKLDDVFEKVFLNFGDEQPHVFKEKTIRQLDLDYYFEDDRDMVDLLQLKFKNKIFWVKQGETITVNDKKKILFSLTYYEPNISGVTIYVKRLAEGMVKRGYQITILSSWYQKTFPQREKKNGVKILREKVHLRLGKGVLMFGLPITAWREVGRNDIVICHLPQLESFILAVIAKIKRKRLILVYHADLFGWRGIVNNLGILLASVSHFTSAVLADKIVAYTKDYAEYSYFLKYFKKKLVFIYPPVIIEKPSSQYRKLLAEKLLAVDIKIGFAGRIAREKGLSCLIKAIPYLQKKLGNFKIILAGPDKIIGEDYRKEIKDLINQYKDHLMFLGSLDQAQLSSFFKTIDILVLPSSNRLESFGLVQVEAMLNGCPVAASNLPGIRVPIRLTKMGKLISSQDPKDIAIAMSEVILNKRKYMKEKEKIEKIFSFRKTINDYERLFD